MRSSLTKCVLITNICNACFRGVTWKNWVAQVWQAGLKGCFPLSPPFMSLSVFVSLMHLQQNNKKKKQNNVNFFGTYDTQRKPMQNRKLSSAVCDTVSPLRSRSKPHNSAPAKKKNNPPTTTSLKAPMSARKCNSDHLLAVYDRADSVACTYLRCI